MRLIFEGPDSGTELVRTVTGPNAPSSVEVRFEPANGQDRLIGEPSEWCNRPRAGESLVFTVPAPPQAGDDDVTGTLIVRSASQSASTRIPIVVKHTD